MTAAHAPRDHHSPGCTRYQMRVPQTAGTWMLSEARLAVASDLLNVAKALLARSCAAISASSLVRRPASADLAPPNAPHRRTVTGSTFEFCV
jgi:hypothetical protein